MEILSILTVMENWLLHKSVKTVHKGIGLCDINLDNTDDADFIFRTKQALDLIESSDPKCMRRIQREIRYIANRELVSAGEYRRRSKTCMVDFGRYPFKAHAEWALCLYAGNLVHEATHGMLYTRGIPYSPLNREKIERICHHVECRFFNRVRPEWREYLIKDFDPSRWHFRWHASRWAQLRAVFARAKESRTLAARVEKGLREAQR